MYKNQNPNFYGRQNHTTRHYLSDNSFKNAWIGTNITKIMIASKPSYQLVLPVLVHMLAFSLSKIQMLQKKKITHLFFIER